MGVAAGLDKVVGVLAGTKEEAWAWEASAHGVMAHMGFSQRTPAARQVSHGMDRQAQDTRAQKGWPAGLTCPIG